MTRLGSVGVCVLLMFPIAPIWAQVETRRMLHGLDTVSIDITQLHPDAELGGLTLTALREEIIINLQQAGLQVLPLDGRSAAPERPQLSLSVNITPIETFPVYSVSITLQLRQSACLTRNLIICEPVITWEETSNVRTISVSQLTEVRQDVRTLIARFVDAYLAENPKR